MAQQTSIVVGEARGFRTGGAHAKGGMDAPAKRNARREVTRSIGVELGQTWAKGAHVMWCAGEAVGSRCGSDIYVGRRQRGLERAEGEGPRHQTGSQMQAAGSNMRLRWAERVCVYGISCMSGLEERGESGKSFGAMGRPRMGVCVCWGEGGLPLTR